MLARQENSWFPERARGFHYQDQQVRIERYDERARLFLRPPGFWKERDGEEPTRSIYLSYSVCNRRTAGRKRRNKEGHAGQKETGTLIEGRADGERTYLQWWGHMIALADGNWCPCALCNMCRHLLRPSPVRKVCYSCKEATHRRLPRLHEFWPARHHLHTSVLFILLVRIAKHTYGPIQSEQDGCLTEAQQERECKALYKNRRR
jgi:hypothetical protein